MCVFTSFVPSVGESLTLIIICDLKPIFFLKNEVIDTSLLFEIMTFGYIYIKKTLCFSNFLLEILEGKFKKKPSLKHVWLGAVAQY
jgi:hypothetical protein